MSRILVSGVCPLPFENAAQNHGPGLRSWQLAAGLAGAGHEVLLVAMEIPGAYGEGSAPAEEQHDGVAIHRLAELDFLDSRVMGERLRAFRPDAVVGATLYGSYALTRCVAELPFWADQFGHVMAEAQARAALDASNWPLAHFWKLLEPVMSRADKISCVSATQRWAAVGELGALGRLNAETCGYDFTALMPCALCPPPKPASERRLLRGERLPEDAFLVLWSGGFNVWSDVDTLFRGLEKALQEDPRIHFVSTGGEIEGHNTRTYARLKQQVADSPRADRFFLEGWVPHERVPAYVAEADLGVLSELPIYEGMLGSKNRIVQWMGCGLPVASNPVGDLGRCLAEQELGLSFPVGDADALAERILWAAGHPAERAALAERARRHAEREFSIQHTTRELCAWAEDPRRAPDAALRRRIRSPRDYADLRQRLTDRAERLPLLGSSQRLRAAWRRIFPRGRTR